MRAINDGDSGFRKYTRKHEWLHRGVSGKLRTGHNPAQWLFNLGEREQVRRGAETCPVQLSAQVSIGNVRGEKRRGHCAIAKGKASSDGALGAWQCYLNDAFRPLAAGNGMRNLLRVHVVHEALPQSEDPGMPVGTQNADNGKEPRGHIAHVEPNPQAA